MNEIASSLLTKVKSREALVGIIGLGYVGLPLALAFAERGFRVLGFDVDPHKVQCLRRGECYIKHIERSRILAAVESERFSATSEFGRLSEPDVILICVPTPLGPHREPDMRYVEGSAWQIRNRIRKGQLIVLESTTYPGTTDELVLPILADTDAGCSDPQTAREVERGERFTARAGSGDRPDSCRGDSPRSASASGLPSLVCGKDFFLAFSPEREDPGNPRFGTTNTPKVVGGVDQVSGDLAEALYEEVMETTVRVGSARIAEAAKLMENIFRAVNIALVNELKIVFDRLDIDIWDVLDAADTKPFGFMRFNPGPGLGGHCIPIDPFYLAWKAREHGVSPKFIELAGEVNMRMPEYVTERLSMALNERGIPVKDSRVLVLGLAYKPDVDDPRESPAFEIIDLLLARGAHVSYHDPHIPTAPRMRSWPDLPLMSSVALTAGVLQAIDVALIVTDHRAVDYELILEYAPLVVDTRGVFRHRNGKVRRA
ncbi:MAG TPA: nucleotide sugar dehydrogenase [Thermoanaerobaculales bacterium]|nr:nucleotide sugar dehydrogenase [Thermoanaerobaculales bacterium]